MNEPQHPEIECDGCAGRPWTPPSREELLGGLVPGDLVQIDNGLLGLVTGVSSATVAVRRLLVQHDYEFDRATGVSTSPSDGGDAQITSVKPLPADIYAVLLTLDRKQRLPHASHVGPLSDAEKNALIASGRLFKDNPL